MARAKPTYCLELDSDSRLVTPGHTSLVICQEEKIDQESVFSCYLSVFSCYLSVFSCYLHVLSCYLSVFSCYLSVLPEKAEEIWHANQNSQQLLQRHGREHLYHINHSVVWILHCPGQKGTPAWDQNSSSSQEQPSLHYRTFTPLGSPGEPTISSRTEHTPSTDYSRCCHQADLQESEIQNKETNKQFLPAGRQAGEQLPHKPLHNEYSPTTHTHTQTPTY